VRCSDFVAVGGMCVFRPKILGGRLHVARRVQLKFLRLLARAGLIVPFLPVIVIVAMAKHSPLHCMFVVHTVHGE
jgi:hypothetical protein